MAKTVIGVGDPKAVRRYGSFLAVDVARTSYFNRKFMGEGVEAETPLQTLYELENDAGDTITYDLVMQLRMKPVEGDETLRGKEEDLKFYTDEVKIDQMRGGVNTGGKMSRKRTIHDLRKIARAREKEWWARIFDELWFMYLSGARGVNDDYIFDTNYTGFAGNAFSSPDADHLLYSGAATSKASLVAGDIMDLTTIEKVVVRAKTMGGGTQKTPRIQPCMIEGEERFVLLMHSWDVYNLRTNTSTGQWLDIQKALATAVGNKSPIFMGGVGYHNNTVLHEHEAVIRFSDYGAGSNIPASRSLFMGRQSGVCAFGSPGTGLRFDWNEETEDRGNQIVITTSSIFGMKKTHFTIESTTKDFGVIAIDSASANPAP